MGRTQMRRPVELPLSQCFSLLLLLLFTVRLEQLQEKSIKENNSLGESTPLWSLGHTSPPLLACLSSVLANITSSSCTNEAWPVPAWCDTPVARCSLWSLCSSVSLSQWKSGSSSVGLLVFMVTWCPQVSLSYLKEAVCVDSSWDIFFFFRKMFLLI